MSLVLQGVFLGLTLAILLGPIFVTLIQLALEKGIRAGIVASIGVWVSDIIIILLSYMFIHRVKTIVTDETFVFWMGLLGGFILIIFGLGTVLKKVEIKFSVEKHSTNDYIAFWMRGFLVNTVNPFTFVFWIGVISTYVIGSKISRGEAAIFFTSIMAVIILTDIAKVILAKKIRNKLKQHHFKIFSYVAGIGLIVFGLVLLLKTQLH